MRIARPFGKGLHPVGCDFALQRSILVIDCNYPAASVNLECPSATDAVVAIVVGMERGAGPHPLDCKKMLRAPLTWELCREQPPPGADRRSRLLGVIRRGRAVQAIGASPQASDEFQHDAHKKHEMCPYAAPVNPRSFRAPDAFVVQISAMSPLQNEIQ